MPRAVRTDSIDIDRQTSVRAVIEQTPDADHAAELTLKNDGERWVYTLTDEREAAFRRSTTITDVAAEPEPPTWVQKAFEMLDIREAE